MADLFKEQRIRRELRTVKAMIGIYCRARHGTSKRLCGDCVALWEYTQQRVDRCVFRSAKPVCAKCAVHCFAPARREQIRAVMRYAGPRMLPRHPILTLLHFLDGRKPVPSRSPAA